MIEDTRLRNKRFGDFEILSELGRGGMGIVYEARQLSLNRKVALKVLPPGLGMTSKAVGRFHREAQAAAKLHHSNIVAIYAEGEEEGTCYYAMELIEGRALDQVIAELRGTQPTKGGLGDVTAAFEAAAPSQQTSSADSGSQSGVLSSSTGQGHFDTIARWMADAADALHYAHRQGVIHRDVKPSNLMVEGDERIKLMDFGLARMLEQPGMTVSGEFLGTPRYMSPEQIAAGRIRIDHRTDIYSLGTTLYELLTLEPAFPGEHREEVIAAIMHKEPRRPRQLQKRVPVDLETICLKAIEKDPERRYPSAGEFADDLRRYINRHAIAARRVGPLGRAVRFVRRHKLPVAGAAALLVTASMTGVLWWKYQAAQATARAQQQQREQLERERDQLAREAEAERSFYAAQKLHAEGRYAEALSQVGASLELDPTRADARLLRTRLLFEQDRADEAVSALEKLLSDKHGDAHAGAAHFLLAAIYHGSDASKAEHHQQQGEELLPDTADAHHLRAMTARTLEETLRWLDAALQLDPSHFPSIRASILAAYSRKDYAKMELLASQALSLRPKDASLWSLRGVARREMGKFDQAPRDHDRAVGLATEDVEAYELRRETYERTGNYEKALADARRCLDLDPDEPIFRFRVFLALVRLGLYEAARQEYAAIAEYGQREQRWFASWLKKQIFGAMAAGEPFQLPPDTAPGDAFSIMRDAAEYYRTLTSKNARRLVAEGLRANWSPDGTEIAYGAGSYQSRVLEILNLESNVSRLLAIPGMDPMWSPDGKYIAFIRTGSDRSVVEPTTDRGPVPTYFIGKQEIWIATPDGRQLRRLTAGYAPSWGRSSERVFFHNRQDRWLYSVSLSDPDVAPRRILLCPGNAPVVSPDERYVATAASGRLWILDFPSGAEVARWDAPEFVGLVSWSPDGREVSVTGVGEAFGASSMWIYDVEERAAWKVLDGPVTRGFWSRDGSKFAFDIRQRDVPSEIWVAELDPNVPTYQALGPAQTPEQYVESKLAKLIRAIKLQPEDANLYQELVRTYVQMGRWDEAIASLTNAIERMPDNVNLLNTRGRLYARRGQWRNAATDLARAIELDPSNHWNWYHCAPLYVQIGDVEGYLQHCRKMLERFGNTDRPMIAERTAKACLLVPDPVDRQLPAKLAGQALTLGADHPALKWCQLAKGMADYRNGQFASAIEWLRKVLPSASTAVGNPYRDTKADLFLAMAHHELGQADDARQSLAKATRIMETQLPKIETGDLGGSWPDWLMCQIIRREAEALLGGSPKEDVAGETQKDAVNQ